MSIQYVISIGGGILKSFAVTLVIVLLLSGCNINSEGSIEKEKKEPATEVSNESTDFLNIGDKHYINAWELALVDNENILKISEVEHASRLSKGSAIYEIEGYPVRSIVAVKEANLGL